MVEKHIPGRRMSLRVAGYPTLLNLPQFVAEANGYYDERDLGVSFVFPAPTAESRLHAGIPWSDEIEDVSSGRADVLLQNVWTALRSATDQDPLVPFAYCSQQCRYVLLARPGETRAPFLWQDLCGKTVVFPSDTPTPWMAFREVLFRQGVSLDEIRVIIGFTPQQALEEFARGVGDYLYNAAERMQGDRFVEIAAVSDVLGPVPWVVFLAHTSALAILDDELKAFRHSIGRAQQWIREHDSGEIANVVRERFHDIDAVSRQRVIERYKSLELWPPNPDLPLEHVERWQEVLLRWGLVRNRVSLDRLFVFKA